MGVFDYDGEKEQDDFIGKAVVDIPQLQSGFLYDLTLPLRDMNRIYNRKKIGAQSLFANRFVVPSGSIVLKDDYAHLQLSRMHSFETPV